MAKVKNYMPMSTAGLVRYFEEAEGKIKIRPEHIVGACILFILIEILLIFI